MGNLINWCNTNDGFLTIIMSLVGLCITIIATVFAIIVPKKIADRQNKIALFERRLAFYETLNKCVIFAKMIKINNNEEEKDEIQNLFVTTFSTKRLDFDERTLPFEKVNYIEQVTAILKQGQFLFDIGNKEFALLESSLVVMLVTKPTEEDYEKYCCSYIDIADKIEKELLPKINNMLKLNNN